MAVIKRDGNSMGLPMNITRGNPIPLDSSSIYYTYAEAQVYAQTDPTAYVGQVIAVVDETSSTSDVYVIANTSGTLNKLESGGSTLPIFITDPQKGQILTFDDTLGKWVNETPTDINNTIEFVKTSLVADYSASKVYPLNAIVKYDNKVWKCGTAITTCEPWNSNHWIETKLSEQFNKCGTNEYWTTSTYVPAFGEIIIYTDVKNFKIGDGTTLASNLEFSGVSQTDRERWDNKVRCYMATTEEDRLIFTTN